MFHIENTHGFKVKSMFGVGGEYEEVFEDDVREIALVILSEELHV